MKPATIVVGLAVLAVGGTLAYQQFAANTSSAPDIVNSAPV